MRRHVTIDLQEDATPGFLKTLEITKHPDGSIEFDIQKENGVSYMWHRFSEDDFKAVLRFLEITP